MERLLLENLLYDSDILALLTNISVKALLASSIPFSDFSNSVFKKFDIIKLILSDFKGRFKFNTGLIVTLEIGS